ncbi:MAG: HDOD domain-containing protein [Spirochaetales bacterium]|nr:HDOD domain-containing protein [Spirochaetales bacterium]
MPDIAAKVLSIPEDDATISFKELENLIKVDPGLTTKILKVANSAMYARQKEITTLQTAFTMLGFKTIKSLVFLISASSMLKDGADKGFYKRFWKHSILSAFTAQNIAERAGFARKADESFLAGLLHDIGETALFNADPDLYLSLSSEEEETDAFGTDHKEVGEMVLNEWDFPSILVDTAREHGSLNITSPHKTIILIVSAADLIAKYYSDELETDLDDTMFDAFLMRINLTEKDKDFYLNDFHDKLIEEPMFKECSSLFGL